MYRCETCQTNPNSCICEECFKNGNHEGHKYFMETLEDGHSGTCDCGSEAAWKREGWCKNHGKTFDGNLDTLIPEKYRNCFIEKINVLLDFICDKIEELYDLRLTKESITEEDQNIVVNAIELLKKCMSIDLFHMKIFQLMKERRKQYKTRVTMKSKKYETITMDELLIDTGFWDYQLVAKTLKPLLLDFMTGDVQSEQYAGFIYDEIVDIYENEEVTNEMCDNIIGVFVQISSNDELNQKYFFDNEERCLNYLNVMKKLIENIIQSDFETIGRKIALQSINFARHMSEILMATNNRLLKNKKYYEKLMELFELGMFFNAEYRKRDKASEFPNKEDYKLIDAMNFVVEWFYVSIDSLTKEELMYIIDDMYKRYIQLYDKHIVTEKIELGITQPFSMFNHMLSCLLFAISHTENPVEILSSFPEKKKLLVYPILFIQFGEEYPNRLWLRNTGSQIKLIKHFQGDLFNHMLYNYLFQLCSNDKQLILETIDEVCKLHIDIEAEETEEMKKERKLEMISGGLTSLKIIHNMLHEVVFANKLSIEEIAQYSYITHMYFGLVQTHVYKRYVPSFVYNIKHGYDPAMELISVCVQKNGKLMLNDDFKQFVNPYYPYIAPWSIDEKRDKYYKELNTFTPSIFMLERRDKEMHQNIMNILNSIEVTQMILTYLKTFPDSTLICEIVEQLLLDRIMYHDNCEYDETHQQLLFEIGVCLAQFKGWKEAHVIKKCLQTPLESIFKGFESIVGVEEKPNKAKALSKKDQIMMKIKQKQEAFKKQHGIEDEKDEKTNENIDYDNICIICMSDENSEECPLGRMVFVHENNCAQFSEYQETHDEDLLGSYENGNWKKPYANEHGCWKWEPCHNETTDLQNDAVSGKIVSCCQHKIHYECYIYQKQLDQENKFMSLPHLQGLASCPLCTSFSSHFIPTQKPIELDSSVFEEEPVENIDQTIQMTIFELLRRSEEKELTQVEQYAILETIVSSLPEEERTPMNQYLHLTQIVNSTIASYEIQMRENNQTKFEQIAPILNSYLLMCIKLASSFEIQEKALLLAQLIEMRPNKNAFLQLIRIFCLLPHRWNNILTIANLREFISIETEIFEHSSKPISIPNGNCEKKEILPQYEQYQTEDELIMALAQIYLRKVELLKQAITLKFEPLKDLKEQYEYPYQLYKQYHIAHQTTCLPSIVRPTIPREFKLITLPKTHQELLSQATKMKCCDCGKEGSEILEHCGICLHCGSLVCLNIRNDSESKTHSPSSAVDHMHKCSGKSGLILGVQSSIVLYFVDENIIRIMTQLYKTKLGDIPSSRNLYSKMEYELMEDYYEKIRKLYLNGDLISNPEFGFMKYCDM